MSIADEFLRNLPFMVGKECWGAIGGEGTGSIISLKIGAQVLMSKPLGNPHLTELERRYESAYTLMVWCPWRIDTDSRVVAASYMSNANDGPMVRGLDLIRGQKITAVSCSGPAYDLRVDFDNAHALVIHCSGFDMDYEDCYDFGTPHGWYSVNLGGDLSFDPDSESQGQILH